MYQMLSVYAGEMYLFVVFPLWHTHQLAKKKLIEIKWKIEKINENNLVFSSILLDKKRICQLIFWKLDGAFYPTYTTITAISATNSYENWILTYSSNYTHHTTSYIYYFFIHVARRRRQLRQFISFDSIKNSLASQNREKKKGNSYLYCSIFFFLW